MGFHTYVFAHVYEQKVGEFLKMTVNENHESKNVPVALEALATGTVLVYRRFRAECKVQSTTRRKSCSNSFCIASVALNFVFTDFFRHAKPYF